RSLHDALPICVNEDVAGHDDTFCLGVDTLRAGSAARGVPDILYVVVRDQHAMAVDDNRMNVCVLRILSNVPKAATRNCDPLVPISTVRADNDAEPVRDLLHVTPLDVHEIVARSV